MNEDIKPEGIFLEIFKNLSRKDQSQLIEILRDYPEYFDYLITNYRNKKDALATNDRGAMKDIIAQEKAKLVTILERNGGANA